MRRPASGGGRGWRTRAGRASHEGGGVPLPLPALLARPAVELRPRGVPIYAFTDIEHIFRAMLLPWGVEPFLMDFCDDPEETILNAFAYLKRQGWAQPGSWMVVITNVLARGRIIDSIQLRQVE